MRDWLPFQDEAADSREAIMRATFVALRKHGYAGLSIQRIADEADLSKSTFYHHFDNKDDLMRTFVEFVLDGFAEQLRLEAGDDPVEFVQTYIDIIVAPEEVPFFRQELADEMFGVYIELRAQAGQDDAFRQKFSKIDESFEAQLAGVIRDGIEQGEFRDVDADAAAAFILTLEAGHIMRLATSNIDSSDDLRSELKAYVDQCLLAE